MSQRLGKAFIKADGKLLETMPGAKIDIGGVTRNTVVGANAVHGYAEQTKQSRLECEVSVGADTSLEEIAKIADATVTFECDTGQTYIMRNAWLVDPPVMTEGEGGRVPLVFEGAAAEEMRS
ncbi:MAG: phage tail tube protein [Rubrivivax sp.]|nr:phage tail tube protein [Rubrivivax sp.]